MSPMSLVVSPGQPGLATHDTLVTTLLDTSLGGVTMVLVTPAQPDPAPPPGHQCR